MVVSVVGKCWWSRTATLAGVLPPVKHFFNYFNLFCCGWSPTYYSSAMPNKRDANKIKTMSDTTAPTVGSAAHCSAATVREALQRCATMDDGFAHSALMDAGKCEKSDHPAIRERASEMKLRADTYKLRAARYRAALDWLVG